MQWRSILLCGQWALPVARLHAGLFFSLQQQAATLLNIVAGVIEMFFFSLQQQATTLLNIVAGVIEMVR